MFRLLCLLVHLTKNCCETTEWCVITTQLHIVIVIYTSVNLQNYTSLLTCCVQLKTHYFQHTDTHRVLIISGDQCWLYLLGVLLSAHWYNQRLFVSMLVVCVTIGCVCECVWMWVCTPALILTGLMDVSCPEQRWKFVAWLDTKKVTNIALTVYERANILTPLSAFSLFPLNSTLANLLSVLDTGSLIRCFDLIYRSHLSLITIWLWALRSSIDNVGSLYIL